MRWRLFRLLALASSCFRIYNTIREKVFIIRDIRYPIESLAAVVVLLLVMMMMMVLLMRPNVIGHWCCAILSRTGVG